MLVEQARLIRPVKEDLDVVHGLWKFVELTLRRTHYTFGARNCCLIVSLPLRNRRTLVNGQRAIAVWLNSFNVLYQEFRKSLLSKLRHELPKRLDFRLARHHQVVEIGSIIEHLKRHLALVQTNRGVVDTRL